MYGTLLFDLCCLVNSWEVLRFVFCSMHWWFVVGWKSHCNGLSCLLLKGVAHLEVEGHQLHRERRHRVHVHVAQGQAGLREERVRVSLECRAPLGREAVSLCRATLSRSHVHSAARLDRNHAAPPQTDSGQVRAGTRPERDLRAGSCHWRACEEDRREGSCKAVTTSSSKVSRNACCEEADREQEEIVQSVWCVITLYMYMIVCTWHNFAVLT